MQKKFEIIPRIMWMPLILTLTLNSITYFGSRQFTSNRYHFDLSNRLDDGIPFVPWTVVIYLGCYVFWVINYVIGRRGTGHFGLSAPISPQSWCACSVIWHFPRQIPGR